MNSTMQALQADYASTVLRLALVALAVFFAILGFHRSTLPRWLKRALGWFAFTAAIILYGYLLLAPFFGS